MLCWFRVFCWAVLATIAVAAEPVSAATPMVSAGDEHVLALRSDGKVFAWGNDLDGRLGIGRNIAITLPVAVPGLPPMAGVAAGRNHILGVARNGQLWAWGQNDRGQLGDGSRTDTSKPALVKGLEGVSTACGGRLHSMALKQDGTVWAWGLNAFGQLGDGTNNDSATPVQVMGLAQITAIQCGEHSGIALQADGAVWSWGNNTSGGLGDGTTNNRNRASRIAGLSNVSAIAAGNIFTLALTRDGSVWWWGWGFPNPQLTPILLSTLSNRVSGLFASSTAISYVAIGLDPTLWWLGTNLGPTAAQQPSVGRLAGAAIAEQHRLLLRADGTVLAAGANAYGQLGIGNTQNQTTHVLVSALSNIVAVAAGIDNSVALDGAGTVFVWGSDARGQIGTGQQNLRSMVPKEIVGLNNIVQVSAGRDHSMALDQSGFVWAWGNGEQGVIGDGENISRSTPVRVPNLSNVTSIAAGASTSFALMVDGSVAAWGMTPGDGSFRSNVPLTVLGLSPASAIATSGSRFVVMRDGSLWAWGQNNLGQLGIGTKDPGGVPRPVRVAGISNVQSVYAGFFNTFAIGRDGTVMSWGNLTLGRKGVTESLTPAPIVIPKTVAEIGVARGGGTSVLARLSDGTVWAWGANNVGELGDLTGVFGSREEPFRIPSLTAIAGIATGWSGNTAFSGFSTLLRQDGYVMGSGVNRSGQLGDGTLADRRTFVLAINPSANGFLNLDTTEALPPPASLAIPFFVASTGTVGENTVIVSSQVFPRADAIATTQSTYVFALAPSSLVQGAALKGGANVDDAAYHVKLKATASAGFVVDPKEGPLGCVLAQLNSAGQLTAVSASNLQAFVTGVLAAGGTSVNVLNNISAAAIQGSTFYVGYGTTGASMINSGTNRSVVTVPGANVCQPQAPQTGWWWNAAQDGRGFGIEVRGNTLFMSGYLYDDTGHATWVVAAGKTALDGSLFNDTLYHVSNGQTLTGPYKAPAPVTLDGPITLSFTNARNGTLIWPGGVIPIVRFDDVIGSGNGVTPSFVPENGWWWNASESGRGFFMEFKNNFAFIAGYMYEADGRPVWYTTQSTMASPQTFSSNWLQAANGQTLTGPYKKPVIINSNVGPVTFQFSDTANAILTLPGGRQVAITRHRF